MMGILHSLFKMAACVSGVLVIAQASGIAPQWKDLTAQSYQIYLIVVTVDSVKHSEDFILRIQNSLVKMSVTYIRVTATATEVGNAHQN